MGKKPIDVLAVGETPEGVYPPSDVHSVTVRASKESAGPVRQILQAAGELPEELLASEGLGCARLAMAQRLKGFCRGLVLSMASANPAIAGVVVPIANRADNRRGGGFTNIRQLHELLSWGALARHQLDVAVVQRNTLIELGDPVWSCLWRSRHELQRRSWRDRCRW